MMVDYHHVRNPKIGRDLKKKTVSHLKFPDYAFQERVAKYKAAIFSI